jgi:hypothetical protein
VHAVLYGTQLDIEREVDAMNMVFTKFAFSSRLHDETMDCLICKIYASAAVA